MTWPCLSIILFYFQLAVCPTVCPTMKVQLVQLIIICEIWCSSPFSEITFSVSISPPDGSRAQLFEIWPFWTRISPSLSYFFVDSLLSSVRSGGGSYRKTGDRIDGLMSSAGDRIQQTVPKLYLQDVRTQCQSRLRPHAIDTSKRFHLNIRFSTLRCLNGTFTVNGQFQVEQLEF